MQIASVEIQNYKSFRASASIELLPGINVVVGENNTGKTSLIDALATRFANHPHRSSETYRGEFLRPPAESEVFLRFVIGRQELMDALESISPFAITLTPGVNPFDYLQPIPSPAILECRYRGFVAGKTGSASKLVSARLEHIPHHLSVGSRQRSVLSMHKGTITRVDGDPKHDDYASALAAFAKASVYAFKAERYNLGSAAAGNSSTLAPDASNLAEVLSVLQKHPAEWQQFRRYVRAVFPQLHDVSVGPAQPNVVEIQIWNEPPEGLPQELAVSVSESGTGIGQVLAILAVVVMSQYSRTIIIDEPQSFLHPGALRTLIEILSEHSRHQFVIATHSPTVITAAAPAQILKTVRNKTVTEVQRIDPQKTEDLRAFLQDIGARLSDVFGVERILWVEGATEEACFPEIVSLLAKPYRYGTKILGVLHTADFGHVDAAAVVRTYRKLSAGEGLLPVSVGFLFDRETRTKTEIEDLKRMGAGTIDFLPCRMFENYLLDADAIATVMGECTDFRDPPVTSAEVSEWITTTLADAQFDAPRSTGRKPLSNDLLIERVNAARLLEKLFEQLSEGRCLYRKILHGLRLTRLLLISSPERFRPIVDQIQSIEAAAAAIDVK